MTFNEWKSELATKLEATGITDNGAGYIAATGDECWAEAFKDGLSPAEAASEEIYAAANS